MQLLQMSTSFLRRCLCIDNERHCLYQPLMRQPLYVCFSLHLRKEIVFNQGNVMLM